MLLHGMRGTKRSFMFITILVFIVILITFMCACNQVRSLQYHGSEYYSEKMLQLFETSDKLIVKDVFDFDFDKAYVSDAVYADDKYFLEKLNVETTIDIPTLETGAHNRVLFIKDNKIIYDFIYQMYEIRVFEMGTWIYPDTIITMGPYKTD